MSPSVDPLIIPIIAISMPLLLVPTIMLLKHRYKRREWEHLERMKEMDGPQPLGRLVGSVGAGGVAAIGAGVPAAAVLAAFLTTLFWRPAMPYDFPVPVVVAWGAAVLISAGAMVTSLLLANLQMHAMREASTPAADAKPAFDPDTFDVVGSRG